MVGPDKLDMSNAQWDDPESTERQQVQRKRKTEIEVGEATAPFAVPKAKAELEGALESNRQKRQERVDKMRADFEGNPDYKRYAVTIPALEAALTTTDDTMGDLALTYYAAKLFDPDSAVREGEQETMKSAEAALARMAEKIKKEFGFDGATFTDEGRVRLRQQLIRRASGMNKSYGRVYKQYSQLAERRGYDPVDVVGEHVGTPFVDTLRAYDAARRAAGARLAPVSSASNAAAGAIPPSASAKTAQTADVFTGPPPGTEIAGELIKGYRLSPESEQAIISYVASPDATPEGFAQMAADRAIAEGTITPDMRDRFIEAQLPVAQEYFSTTKPEQRGRAGTLDYRKVDEAATENAGLGATVAQALRNVPESAAQMAQGLVALPGSAVASVMLGEPVGATRVVNELFREAGSGPTTEATLASLKERYTNPKRTFITDPLGAMADVSLPLTLGGAALGTGSALGRGLTTAGNVLDPVSGITTLFGKGQQYATSRPTPKFAQAAMEAPSEIVAFPSGTGGAALREAAGAGYERRTTGKTPRTEAFTRGMRDSESTGDDVVSAARDAVAKIRENASAEYTAAMQQFGQSPQPLPVANVLTRLQKIKPKNYDAMLNAPKRPSEHIAWEQMMGTVQHYAAEAAQNPALLEPLSMDAFKQDLYDIGSKIGGAYDRDAARIASTAYRAVKDELVKHDPIYAQTMKNYERAANEAQQIEASFGLAAARGKRPNVESSTRKLQSIFRNNANTNYGQRAAQGQRLAELDTTDTIMPTLAGQQFSSWAPRGIQRATALPSVLAAGTMNLPLAVITAGMSSPRIMGEVAYGAGQLAGVGKSALEGLSEAYGAAPTGTLASAQTGSRLEEADLEDLRRRYGMEEPPLMGWRPGGGY